MLIGVAELSEAVFYCEGDRLNDVEVDGFHSGSYVLGVFFHDDCSR